MGNQDNQAILAYLLNILEKGEAARYEAKLLILGSANEGKTLLSRTLRSLEFQHQTTTIGVEIDPSYCKMALNRLKSEIGPLFSGTRLLFSKAVDMVAQDATADLA